MSEIKDIVLISTYWNVNEVHVSIPENIFNVLISTYWNVNILFVFLGVFMQNVLISTYWNVNRNSNKNKTS